MSLVKSDGKFRKELSARNILPPTRCLYDDWFKSYSSLCDYHVCGDLDLVPILTRFVLYRAEVMIREPKCGYIFTTFAIVQICLIFINIFQFAVD